MPRNQGLDTKRHGKGNRLSNFGCWNVQGLSTKLYLLPLELTTFGMDITVLTETKKNGNGEEIQGNFYHLWSGVPKYTRPRAGV